MDLTVLIAVATDVRIKQCILSIDEDCEILVVANGPSLEIIQLLQGMKDINSKIKIITINERNLSKARDIGMHAATYSKVILMDSDCVFARGSIRQFYNKMEKEQIVNGKINFISNNWQSSIVKQVREYLNDPANTGFAFAPGLGLRKEVIHLINGYYFDHQIKWVEDAELNIRIRNAGIKVCPLPSAEINHVPLKILQDLRAAFNYGTGKRIGVKKGIMQGIGAFWGEIPDIIRKKGIQPALFMIVWNLFYISGYILQPYLKEA
ncbi:MULTISPECIES: glycosyltransferase family 2 protein [unclassified Bacillus (in: firmicutes)]|uniref:glycosyltransferase family 2 protein n=1 Tax=unclassified Bacillus (in: firmicutes) TaxID=185979 RepID=UPI0002597C67|nr:MULTISPECIES: glycosyltransferase [unclassified Bacillus (in: firmicutes)]AFI27221.1 Glycosyl transferase family 2 [Bacillus sp. JS]GFM12017.1 glycosyl transferase family 2 [Bacillus sp. FW1]